MEGESHWMISAALVTSSVVAVVANLFLLLIFCRRRGLRTVPNRFVINLLVTNLLSSLLLIPLLIADQEPSTAPSRANSTTIQFGANQTKFEIQDIFVEVGASNASEVIIESSSTVTFVSSGNSSGVERMGMCHFAQASTSFVCTLSILSILLIGVNQYFGVIHSLRYHVYINKCRSVVFILSTWLVALIFSLLSSLTKSDARLWGFCDKLEKNSDIVSIFNTMYAFSFFTIIILAPFVAICVIYVCIYSAAHQNSQRMRQSTSANLVETYINNTDFEKADMPKVQSAPNFAHFVEECASSNSSSNSGSGRTKVTRTSSERANFINVLKHKISNSSVFRYREETRAAKISILVIFLVLFCYVPYGITLILNSELIKIETPQLLNCLSLVFLVLSNIISPFLFAYRNKRVKREIGKIFGVVPPKPPQRLDRPPAVQEPFLGHTFVVPEVIVTCKVETDRKSILKRVCNTSNWASYKKCNFITVPDSCISGEARGSFSSASTQISSED